MIGAPNKPHSGVSSVPAMHTGFSIGGDFKKDKKCEYKCDPQKISVVMQSNIQAASVAQEEQLHGLFICSISCFFPKFQENLDRNETSLKEKDKKIGMDAVTKTIAEDKRIKELVYFVMRKNPDNTVDNIIIVPKKYKKKFKSKDGFNEIFIKKGAEAEIGKMNIKSLKVTIMFSDNTRKLYSKFF